MTTQVSKMTGVIGANSYRMCPANMASGTKSTTIRGRTYTCAVGSTIDVVEVDAFALEAAGWLNLGQVGTTTTRPSYPPNAASEARVVAVPYGTRMVDTTITAAIIFNGAVWVNAVTGATV
jgi:hypothetical protein